MTKNVFCTDIDDVVLDFTGQFHRFMYEEYRIVPLMPTRNCELRHSYGMEWEELNQYIGAFTHSLAYRQLPFIQTSETILRRMKNELGLKLVAITCSGREDETQAGRRECLASVGFDEIHFLNMGASKDKHLKEYKDTAIMYVDDKEKHCQEASLLGIQTRLFPHYHNERSFFNRVKSWNHIYEEVEYLARVTNENLHTV